MRSVRKHYTKSMQKKISCFIQRQQKKNQPKPSFGVYFPFFADLIAYAKTKNKPNSRFIFILFDHFTKSKLFVSFEFYQYIEVAYRFVINGHHYINNKKVICYDVISGIVFTCCFSLSSCLRAFCFRTTK